MKNGPLTEGKTKSQHKKIEHFGLEPPPPPPPRPTGEIIMEGFTKPHRTLGSFISKLFKKKKVIKVEDINLYLENIQDKHHLLNRNNLTWKERNYKEIS